MKGFLFVLVFGFMGFLSHSAELTPPSFQEVTDQVSKAISAGDAAGVAKHFDTSVDVDILGSEGTHSKSQAEQMLRNFFAKNKVEKFEVTHNTSSPSNRSNAFVGWLTTNGKRYRLFVQFAESNSKQIIQEISIKER